MYRLPKSVDALVIVKGKILNPISRQLRGMGNANSSSKAGGGNVVKSRRVVPSPRPKTKGSLNSLVDSEAGCDDCCRECCSSQSVASSNGSLSSEELKETVVGKAVVSGLLLRSSVRDANECVLLSLAFTSITLIRRILVLIILSLSYRRSTFSVRVGF